MTLLNTEIILTSAHRLRRSPTARYMYYTCTIVEKAVPLPTSSAKPLVQQHSSPAHEHELRLVKGHEPFLLAFHNHARLIERGLRPKAMTEGCHLI